MRIRNSIVIAGLLLALCGCRTAPTRSAVSSGKATEATASGQVAADFANQLRGAYSPAGTVFALPTEAAPSQLRDTLESMLRQAGYGVAGSSGEPHTIRLAWEFDPLGDGDYRVTLIAGDNFQSSRQYEKTDDGSWVPASALTLRNEPVPVFRPKRSRVLSKLLARSDAATASPTGSSGALRTGPAALSPGNPRSPRSDPLPTGQTSREPAERPGIAPASVVARSAGGFSEPADGAPPELDEDVIVLSPNSEHVIEISPALLTTADGAVPNPFLQQYQPKSSAHELTFTISGIAFGPKPTVVLNERVCSIGETVEGFRVAGIHPNLVVLRRENFALRIPLQEHGVLVRYP